MFLTDLTIAEGLGLSVLGLAIVFLVLIVLALLIKIMAAVLKSTTKAPAAEKPAEAPAAPAAPAELAPGSAGECKLYDVPDKTAAMIMAIVANKMGKPLNELRFKSIKEVK